MLQVLPMASNLVRWGRLADPTCTLCASGAVQTNKHVLSNCSSPTALHRYTTRHNEVLKLLIQWLSTVITKDYSIYSDLDGRNIERYTPESRGLHIQLAARILC